MSKNMELDNSERIRINMGLLNALAEWFNSLPGDPTKADFDTLVAIVAAPRPRPDTGDLVGRLVEWLRKRGEPDSGIRYEAGGHSNTRGIRHRLSSVELHGSDADFIAKHFHGKGARDLADAISRLSTAPAGDVVLVPREPTEDMYTGKGQNGSEFAGYLPFRDFVWCWRTAIAVAEAAAPTPPQTSPAPEGPVYRVDWENAPRDGSWVLLLDKHPTDGVRIERRLFWSTHYSVYGLGGCWTEGFGTMGDPDFAGWRMDPPPAKAGEGEWQDISTAPRDESYILIRQTDVLEPSVYVACFDPAWSDEGWWLVCDGKNAELPLRGPAPTHWMPIPPRTP